MAEEELSIVELQDNFYRDSFGKVMLIITSIFLAIFILVGISIYLYIKKPEPIVFSVDNEWRVLPPVPVSQPYLSAPDLLQWVSDALPKAFIFDFNNYNDQLKTASQYFTADGWKVFLNQLNTYVNYNNVRAYKFFVSATPTGAPFILNQGLLSGRYAWWIQMPLDINYAGYSKSSKQSLKLQVLVVRVPTVNNLSGVGIDNVIVEKNTTTTTTTTTDQLGGNR